MHNEIAVLGTLAGTIIGALSTGIMNWLAIRANDRKHRRDIIIQAALENYRYAEQHALELSKDNKSAKIPPVDVYIIHMSALLDELLDKRVTKANVIEILTRVNELTDEMKTFFPLENKTNSGE